MKLADFSSHEVIHQINIAHTIRAVALSFVAIYIPIYLFTLDYTLHEIIYFYIVFHIAGLVFTLMIIVPVMKRWGLLHALKLYYPLDIIFLILILTLSFNEISLWLIATIGGAALFSFYVPLNILFVHYTKIDKIGSDYGLLIALPKIFKIAGPIIATILVVFVGFWPLFTIAMIGLFLSYLPLMKIKYHTITLSLRLRSAWKVFTKKKTLFFLEAVDNIIEESEWFWGIYVYLMIDSLATPGIVGSLEAIGAACFALLIGKRANIRTRTLVIVAALGLILISIIRIYIENPLPAYIITLVASFVMTMFLVSYFAMIYRTVKREGSTAEFVILREIPTVIGRLIVFGTILILTTTSLNYFFVLPIIAIVLMLSILITKHHYLAR